MFARSSRLLTVAALLALTATAGAEERVPRVGVVVEVTVGVEPPRADAIAKALADALNAELLVDAFGGGDVSRRLPAEGLAEECLASPDCVADVAARLDADQLLFLALAQIGDELQVDASWVDVASRKVTARPRLVLANDTTARDRFREHAGRFLPDAGERTASVPMSPTPVTIPAVPRHMTTASWIAAGAGVGLVGLGAALGLSARATYTRCERESCSLDELDGLERRALGADVCFGLGAGAAAVAAILYLRSGSPATTELRVTPTPGGATIGLGGAW